jgi:hypothetical protein
MLAVEFDSQSADLSISRSPARPMLHCEESGRAVLTTDPAFPVAFRTHVAHVRYTSCVRGTPECAGFVTAGIPANSGRNQNSLQRLAENAKSILG